MTGPAPDRGDDALDYAGLVAAARALIPALDPGWTDHNAADPGIVLVELLAWLTDMLLYQADDVPEGHVRRMLALLAGPDAPEPAARPLDAAVAATVRGLRDRWRAVTADDYEHLVTHVWPATDAARALHPAGVVHRVRCVPGRDLTGAAPPGAEPAHVSVVVLPEPPDAATTHPVPDAALTTALEAFLDPRRILTTVHHVVGPTYVDVTLTATLALHADAPPELCRDLVAGAVGALLDPLAGGPDGTGRPFGRPVHVSEIYTALEGVALVDHAEDVTLAGAPPVLDDDGRPCGVALADHQLPRLAGIALTAYDVIGRRHALSWPVPS